MNRHIMGCVFVIALLPLFVGDAVASPSMLFSPNEVDFGQRSHIDVFTQEVEIT